MKQESKQAINQVVTRKAGSNAGNSSGVDWAYGGRRAGSGRGGSSDREVPYEVQDPVVRTTAGWRRCCGSIVRRCKKKKKRC